MDFQVQADSGETVDAQGMHDLGYFYSNEGGMVGLENDLLASVEEPLGSQASEKPYIKHFRDADWELGSFLLCSSLSIAAIDEFLGLELVHLESVKALPLSFHTAKELHDHAELLPSVLKWQYHIISMTHPTKQPLHFPPENFVTLPQARKSGSCWIAVDLEANLVALD
ncbi:hypothetical protein DFH29DRAFT_875336 [Suillus ampliporus]|nr:hypothetical protein DFH29DRAFT_875336 [Suillus ampliporus]